MTATLTADDKLFSTCAARAARRAARLYRCFDAKNRAIFFLCQGTFVREFTDLRAVADLLDRMEGRG